MRNAGVQAKPTEMTQWLCELSAQQVAFKQMGNSEIIRFPLDNFLIAGDFPLPAT